MQQPGAQTICCNPTSAPASCELHDYGMRWLMVRRTMTLAVITGLASGPVREAIGRARRSGEDARLVADRLRRCFQRCSNRRATGVSQVMVIEQNHGAQLLRYLRGMLDLPGRPAGFNRPGPLPLRPAELCGAIQAWAAKQVLHEELT